MKRIFCPEEYIASGYIRITDPVLIHYLKDVLRLKTDAMLIVCNNTGLEYTCETETILPHQITLKIHSVKNASAAVNTHLTIACAIPKNARMDDIINTLTQLGVDRIIPLLSERVIVKINKQKEALRLKRWRRIAQNACQQSQRSTIPEISAITSFGELLDTSCEFDLKLIPTLEGNRKKAIEIFSDFKHPRQILVLIGPEGDFTEQETNQAKKAGCIPVSLGNLVLRVDTAAIAIAGFIRFYYGSD
ncbi:MAG: RsmE family RNA methyltransferase [Candidatus Omnitrophota bacterium]|jgi:16S rRNA (uracil1498-N3)-methyltransferase